MNAAQLEKAKTERRHAAETPRCPEAKCWCGLCHCEKCFHERRDNAERRP